MGKEKTKGGERDSEGDAYYEIGRGLHQRAALRSIREGTQLFVHQRVWLGIHGRTARKGLQGSAELINHASCYSALMSVFSLSWSSFGRAVLNVSSVCKLAPNSY